MSIDYVTNTATSNFKVEFYVANTDEWGNIHNIHLYEMSQWGYTKY